MYTQQYRQHIAPPVPAWSRGLQPQLPQRWRGGYRGPPYDVIGANDTTNDAPALPKIWRPMVAPSALPAEKAHVGIRPAGSLKRLRLRVHSPQARPQLASGRWTSRSTFPSQRACKTRCRQAHGRDSAGSCSQEAGGAGGLAGLAGACRATLRSQRPRSSLAMSSAPAACVGDANAGGMRAAAGATSAADQGLPRSLPPSGGTPARRLPARACTSSYKSSGESSGRFSSRNA